MFEATFFFFFGLQIDPATLPRVIPFAVALGLTTALTKLLTSYWAALTAGVDRKGRFRAGVALVAVERILGRSPDKKLDEHMARVMALLSHTDQTLLPCERVAGATVSEQQRLAEQRYDAAMQGLMAELTDDELNTMIDRFEQDGWKFDDYGKVLFAPAESPCLRPVARPRSNPDAGRSVPQSPLPRGSAGKNSYR